MNKIKQYFQQRKFTRYLVLVGIYFAVFAGGQLLLGPPHWVFAVSMAFAMPAGLLFGLTYGKKL